MHCTAQQFCCPIADTTVVSSVTPPLSYGSYGVRLLLLGGEAAEGGPADAAAASAGMQVVFAAMQQRKAAGSMCYSRHARQMCHSVRAAVNSPATGHVLHCATVDTVVVGSVTTAIARGSHGVCLLLPGDEAAGGGPADAGAASAGMQVVCAAIQQRKPAGSMCDSGHARHTRHCVRKCACLCKQPCSCNFAALLKC
jgi:hypothetical protein